MTQAYEMALLRHILKVRYQTFRGEVPMTHKLDDQLRVNLLCHLVVAQLIARARTGDWLRTDHFVESKRLWAQENGVSPDWLESARLASCRCSLQLRYGKSNCCMT